VIPRYTRPEMARIWSDENRFRTWLAVEVAATETLAAAGIVPKEAAKAIHARAGFNVDRIFQIEAEVKHDVIAFTTAVAEIVGVIDYRSHRRDDMADPGIGGRIRVKLLAKVAYQFRRDSGDRQ